MENHQKKSENCRCSPTQLILRCVFTATATGGHIEMMCIITQWPCGLSYVSVWFRFTSIKTTVITRKNRTLMCGLHPHQRKKVMMHMIDTVMWGYSIHTALLFTHWVFNSVSKEQLVQMMSFNSAGQFVKQWGVSALCFNCAQNSKIYPNTKHCTTTPSLTYLKIN